MRKAANVGQYVRDIDHRLYLIIPIIKGKVMVNDKKKQTSGVVDNPFKNIPDRWGKKEDCNSEQVEEQIDTGKIRRVKDLLFEDN